MLSITRSAMVAYTSSIQAKLTFSLETGPVIERLRLFGKKCRVRMTSC